MSRPSSSRRFPGLLTAAVTALSILVAPAAVAAPAGPEPVGSAQVSSAADPVPPPAPVVVPPTDRPVIGGIPVPGETVTVYTLPWLPEDVTLTYQWFAEHEGTTVPVAGATGPDLLVTDDLMGATLLAEVTGSATGADPVTVRTAPTPPVSARVLGDFVPTIVGKPAFGSTLSVTTPTWPVPVDLRYEWFRDGVSTAYGEPTYRPLLTDVGARISVRVTASRPGYEAVTAASTPTTPVTLAAFTTSPDPTLAGTVRVGSRVDAMTGRWTEGASFTYQWLVDGKPVPGATASTYTPVAADHGKKLAVTLRASRYGYETVARTSAAQVVAAGVFSASPVPVVAGAVRVGSKLTAQPGTWTPGATFTYQWKANNLAIKGATTATYTPTATDLGKRLTLTVTATRPGYTTKTLTSTATTAVTAGIFTTAPAPKITGTARVGSTLTASRGTWSPTATYTYQWKRNGIAIKGATRSTYTLTTADHAKRITFTVTAKRTGYTTTTRTSTATATVVKPFTTTKAPTITGTARVGSTLRATAPTWTPAATTTTYQWKANGTPITGATRNTLTLTTAHHGKTITVTTTGKRTAYITATRTSTPTAAVTRAFASTSAPVVSGNAWLGTTLSAWTPAWSPSASLTYTWKRDGVTIPGARSTSYRLTASDVGKRITVTVTGSRSTYATASRVSAPTAKVSSCRVKGNHSSSGEWIYHVPGGQFYAVTIPEACFDTEAQAVAAGYRKSKR
ncbi:hypothetical protein H9623_10305 [Oerskovia sp. Sa1BUA8]|uniref:Ig-like domain-containing protein n=1 Tax=Oerskovia douganii TaxID=2762210 RepID=A0A9D5YZM8_9CELL|nr:hypothetical protein [Oerskovia douganii]MBE7700691.1 hypothetical protein [Oerskovia douganii]